MTTDLPRVDWAQWTVILLKPDCLARNLTQQVLAWVGREVRVVDARTLHPTQEQVFAHYDDMLPLSDQLGRDVSGELRRIFVGQPTGLALGHGPNAAPRVRKLLGPTDPAQAPATTIRGCYAADTLTDAVAQGRLVNNLIHSSDTVDLVHRDFRIWYGPTQAHLLHPPHHPPGGAP